MKAEGGKRGEGEHRLVWGVGAGTQHVEWDGFATGEAKRHLLISTFNSGERSLLVTYAKCICDWILGQKILN